MLAAPSCLTFKPKAASLRHLALSSCMALLCLGLAPSAAAQNNNLGRVLEQAKERGLLIERGEERPQDKGEVASVDAPQQMSEISIPQTRKTAARFKAFPAASCEAARVLDFRPLKGLGKYDQLRALLVPSAQDDEAEFARSDELNRARFYLSLGLGAEAKAALGGDTSEEAALLYKAASLIDHYSDNGAAPVKFSDYAACGEGYALWARFEPSDKPIMGEQQRAFITVLEAFPPLLADRILLNVATLSAERGDLDVAKAFRLVMENRALEAGQALPQERSDDAHLYLNALMLLPDDRSKALGMLKFLSEREGVFQIPALQKIVELQSGKGLSDGQKASLYDVGFLTNDPVQKEQAARIRMDIYLAEDAVTDAIDLVKSDMRAGSDIHDMSVQNIGRSVLGAVLSHDSEEQLGGLNDYYYDTGFFKAFKDYGQLQTALIKAAIALELPKLARDFQMDEPSKEQADLTTQAKLLEAIQAGEKPANITIALDSDLSQSTLKTLLQNALRLRDFDTALKVAARLTGEGDKDDAMAQIYWAQAQWTQLSQQDDAHAPQIVQLLAAPLLDKPKLTTASSADGQNIAAVGEYLTQLGSALEIAKEYLNHG